MRYLSEIENDRLQAYLLDYTENELQRHSAAEEDAVFMEIERGDVAAVELRIASANADTEIGGRVGKMASKPEKSLEYMVCISIALASRAAVRGGLDLNISYTITDLFLRHLEKCVTMSDIIKLQKDAMLIFAEQVRDSQVSRSRYAYIEGAKNYIARHLNKHFTLDDLAAELNINSSYLSRKFTEEVGVSVMRYTTDRRIDAAKNMLRFSDAPISRIAAYLCFPSHSHFGKVFKERTGLTPNAYRNKLLLASDPYRTPESL